VGFYGNQFVAVLIPVALKADVLAVKSLKCRTAFNKGFNCSYSAGYRQHRKTTLLRSIRSTGQALCVPTLEPMPLPATRKGKSSGCS
jgi:hypothetical protein